MLLRQESLRVPIFYKSQAKTACSTRKGGVEKISSAMRFVEGNNGKIAKDQELLQLYLVTTWTARIARLELALLFFCTMITCFPVSRNSHLLGIPTVSVTRVPG
eukprot:3249577-Rhodomonas_salina.2